MAHKVQILSVENIAWARRLVITYHLSQNCFDPNVGGWEYIPDACGYRNVCDADWIVMEPNSQHPLHSSVIKYAGNYFYIWDYGGVEGLNPADFDATHSYIVQIALADHTCNYVDPCANSGYLTPNGLEPLGEPNTAGDTLNTTNNCGPGYHLRVDMNGCLYCQLDPIVDPTGLAPEPESLVFTEPPVIDPPIDPPPTEPVEVETLTPNPDPDPPPITPEDPAEPFVPPILDPTQEPPVEPTDGSDIPGTVVITSGPKIPNSDVDDLGETTETVFGEPDPSPLTNGYSYLTNQSTISIGAYGPGEYIPGALVGTTFGGRPASMNYEKELTAKVAQHAIDLISKANAFNNLRRSADQLNLSPNQISSSSKADITNNITPSSDNAIRSSTKAIDAISVVDNISYVRGRQNSKTELNTFGTALPPKLVPVTEPSALAKQNVNISKPRYVSNQTSQPIIDDPKIIIGSPSNREMINSLNNKLNTISFFADAADFAANYSFYMLSESVVRAGDGIFCEASISSIHKIRYNYTLKIFLKSGQSIKELASSKSVSRLGDIIIAKKLACNVPAGEANVIAVVLDSNGAIIASRIQSVTITEAGS